MTVRIKTLKELLAEGWQEGSDDTLTNRWNRSIINLNMRVYLGKVYTDVIDRGSPISFYIYKYYFARESCEILPDTPIIKLLKDYA